MQAYPYRRAGGRPAFLGSTTERLAQPESEQREDKARNGCQKEGGSPAVSAGHDAPAGEPGGDPNRASGTPDRHCPPTLRLSKVVAQQGCPCRVIAGFADPQHGPRGEELGVVARQPGEQGGEAPDGDADRDHGPPDAPIGPEPEREGRHRVDEQESRAETADRAITQVELVLDLAGHYREDVAIQIVEEVDPDHHGQHVASIAGWHPRIIRNRRVRFGTGLPPAARLGGCRYKSTGFAATYGSPTTRRWLPQQDRAPCSRCSSSIRTFSGAPIPARPASRFSAPACANWTQSFVSEAHGCLFARASRPPSCAR